MNSVEILNPSVSYHGAAHRSFSAVDKMTTSEPLVLILGKDAETRFLYKSFLEMWNYRVVETGSIEEMLTMSALLQPELILIDGNLKFENNLEAIRKVRGNIFLQTTPIILVSGYSQPAVRALALKTGADDFLVKPLIFDDLRVSLQIYIGAPALGERQGGNI